MTRLIKTVAAVALVAAAMGASAADARVGNFNAVSPDGLNELRL